MDGEDLSQLTQPSTQPVLDPRRVNGGQTSGFSDEDIADIICILYPTSPNARDEVDGLAARDSTLVIATPDNIITDSRFNDPTADDASRFSLDLQPTSDRHSIILRLSSTMKDPQLGFVFGRNAARCDVCFQNDPMRRLSNSHFRIYVNEHGVVMLEDRSTNGTIVDQDVLRSKGGNPDKVRRTLSTGGRIKVLMHKEDLDLLFTVRIPRRDGRFEQEYLANVQEFHQRFIMPPPPLPLPLPNPGRNMGPPPREGNNNIQRGNTTAPAHGAAAALQAGLRPVQSRPVASVASQPWDGAGKYNRGDFVGKGAFAMVYKVTNRYNGTPYAAKELDYRRFIKNGVLDQKVENEMKIMRQVRHENIVQYVDHFDWQSRMLIIIMEYVQGGDLGKYVSEHGPLPEVICQEISRQMLSALQYLHENNITHRDVKPDNILISSVDPFTVKLTDFGLSKMVDNEQTFLRTFCGTLLYCAPEVYSEFVEYDLDGRRHPQNRHVLNARRGQRYGHLVDVWSLGGVIFYILTGCPPFPATAGISHTELLHQIMTRPLNIWPLQQRGVSEAGIHFLQLMLQRRPEHRTPIANLLEHPWLALNSQQNISQPGSSFESEGVLEEDDVDDVVTEIHTRGPRPLQNPDDVYDDVEMSDSFLGKLVDNNDYDLDTYHHPALLLHNNDTFGQQRNGAQRPLFGEVGANLGDSGVLPPIHESYSNPSESDSADPDHTIILLHKTAQQNSDQFVPLRPRHHLVPAQELSADASGVSDFQSADQVLSLVEGVASQSLNSEHQNLNPSDILGLSSISEFTTSKRKPAFSSSDEYPEQPSHPHAIKRARSDARVKLNVPLLPAAEDEEMKLIAAIPCVVQSGRQIDAPVNKLRFWDKDRKSYHLEYPEMTQLQMTAFKQAAADRGEKFEPNATPLWGLAMKYFPPTKWSRIPESPRDAASTSGSSSMTSSQGSSGGSNEELSSGGGVPVSGSKRLLLALLESSSDSVISDISIKVHDSIITWGRSPDNLVQHANLRETRIPKTAFKILMWAQDYDASRDRPNNQPWVTGSGHREQEYHFYLSSKATRGIHINGFHLPSHNPSVFASESRHWVRLYNGDELLVWGVESDEFNKLVFRCYWGGSTATRPSSSPPCLIDATTAKKLDDITLKAERRRFDSRFYEARELEANREHERRVLHVDRERARSVHFEELRKKAVEYVRMKEGRSEREREKERDSFGVPMPAGRVQTI